MTIAIVGMGAMGRALVRAFRAVGDDVLEVKARDPWPDISGAEAIILAVRDDAVTPSAAKLAAGGPEGTPVLHCCGAIRATEALAPLVGKRPVGTLHPLVAVTDRASFRGAAFGVEGEVARRLALRLGGVPFEVATEAWPRYHAAAVFAANYVVTLMDVAIRLASDAGLDEARAREALGALATGAVNNVRRLGAEAALTGPIARGDESVVRRHVESLPAEVRSLYEVLAVHTRRLAARRESKTS